MLSSADLEKMLKALDSEAKPAISVAEGFTGWWEGLRGSLDGAQTALAGARNTLRPAAWPDAAGDAFDVRWKMADDSLKPWVASEAPKIADLNAVDQQIINTRVLLVKAIAAVKAAETAATTPVEVNTPAYTDATNAIAAGPPASDAAVSAWNALNKSFGALATAIAAVPPDAQWNGPTGDTGLPPAATAPPRNAARNASPGGPTGSPGGPAGDPQQAAADTPTGEDSGATDMAADAGGDSQMPGADDPGTGLAGLPTAPPPTLPTGPTNVGNLPGSQLPPTLPLVPPPGGIPYPPGTPRSLSAADKLPKGAGLGKSVIGGGGGTARGTIGLGKHDLGGLDLGRGGHDGSTGPAQAARQMNSRPLPTTPQAPTAPAAPAAAGPGGSPAGSTPPPMMPPGAMGSGNGKPKPGTATPVLQGKGRSQNRLPGVPPKLRGRSGKADAAGSLSSFGAPAAAARRRKAEEKEQIDTVQLLDEELWAVEEASAPSTPAAKHGGLSSR